MKNLFLSLFFVSGIISLRASDGYEVSFSQPAPGTFELAFDIHDYSIGITTISGATYATIQYGHEIMTTRKGFAALPYVHASVMLAPDRNVRLEVVPGDYEEFDLTHPLLPSRGIIYRNQDPSSVPYEIDPKSLTDSWYPGSLAGNTDPFILRDIRGTSVYVYPFQYNAVKQVLRVYRNMTVRLVENATPAVNPLPEVHDIVLREMDAIYRAVFINYGNAGRYDLTVGEVGDILVITTSRDEEAIQPYIDWKTEKGYFISKEVVPTGTNVNTLVDEAYAANNNLLYVLLVGDWADIQCNTNSYGAPMDPQVGCVIGDDNFADIAVGRFSANSPADVTVQVNKSIQYEKLPESSAAWYSVSTGIGSAEGPGDDGELDYEQVDVIFTDKLDPFTYDAQNEIYDPGATASMVTTAVNAGTSIINYCGHGWNQGWGTTGFSNSHVAGLSNGAMLPWVVSVACNNGDLHTGTCFAEAWTRKSGGGAVMFLGASISQPWDPPMRGQDYFMDVLIGGYDYSAHPGQSGITTTEQRTTLGAIVFNGLTLMCVESGGSADWETAQTWNIFGDPALQARTIAPAELSLSNTLVMVGIPFSTTVTADGAPVEGAMVALSQGDLMYRGISDAGGMVTIGHALNPGAAKLVATAFNTTTIWQEVTVIPPDGAYVQVAGVEVDDSAGNGDGKLDYGETANLVISLTNVGSSEATDVGAVLGTTDPYATVDYDTVFYGSIMPGDTVTPEYAYQVTAADSLPDLHNIVFDLLASGNSGETWPSSFFLTGHAAMLKYLTYSLTDTNGNGNGRLDPGETAELTIAGVNIGTSDAHNIYMTLGCLSEYVTIEEDSLYYGDVLPAGYSFEVTFTVTADEATPAGTPATFGTVLSAAGGITGQGEFTLFIGQIPVLVLNWDLNSSSPDAIGQCLENLEVGHDMLTTLPEDLNMYASVFVCLGTYPQNHVLTEDEGEVLTAYLEQGGRVFMEGADTWYYDAPTLVHPMFHITQLADGNGDLSTVFGTEGSIMEGMSFTFAGENSYIDQIMAGEGAISVFENLSPAYGCGVSYDGGTYRTVGFSFELGGLSDGEYTRDDVMIAILEFFGITGVWTTTEERPGAESSSVNAYPNPAREITNISVTVNSSSRVILEIFDLNGRRIATLYDGSLAGGMHKFEWSGPDGVYFYRLKAGEEVSTGKIVRY